MTAQSDSKLDDLVRELREQLGANLYSCCVYGSTVRGNAIEGVSDINLLIVLNESTPAAHQLVGGILGDNRRMDPFILGRAGFQRSARAFAAKFSSIKRNYRVLHGADPFAGLQLDPQLERFLCEQALRNLRLRLVYAFVTRARTRSYERFLARMVTPLVVNLSEVLRLNGESVPKEFEGRIGLFEQKFKINAAVLHELLEFKRNPHRLSEREEAAWHERLFPVVDSVVNWVEGNWKV